MAEEHNNSNGIAAPAAPSEVVVMMRPETALRASSGRFASLAGEKVDTIEQALGKASAFIEPLFGTTEERIQAETLAAAEEAQADLEDLSVFYKVTVDPERIQELTEELAEQEMVEAAYAKPGAEPPMLNDMAPAEEDAPPVTPDFSARQGYLDAAPTGVDARWAWTQAGGRGQNMRIIDIEGAWRFGHEDLKQVQGGVVGGTMSTALGWRNHGTAVLGEYGGDRNGIGVEGICPSATASAVSIFGGIGSSQAINIARGRLRRGDIILLELHRPGPRFNFQQRGDQRGYIAIEWWPDDFAAIRNATQAGIIVVEAAGNGAENLDDNIYQNPAAGFPAGWSNPFRRSNRDSGAIVVGAGAPPPGTHGRNHGPDRSRLDFSNWGALIDAQGWGREVTTCGYGDLQGGNSEDVWYTDSFSGTSSASPIVVGVISSLQGMAKARNVAVLSPAQVRRCLRSTGSSQQDAPSRPRTQRIGNRPNLRALASCAFGPVLKVKETKEVLNEGGGKNLLKDMKERVKEIKEKDLKEKDNKEFKEFKEGKEFKEKDKDLVEKRLEVQKRIEVLDGLRRRGQVFRSPDSDTGDTDARLQQLEAMVGELTHFISAAMRPDLADSALNQEQDLEGLSQQLQAEAEQAKAAKDTKDSEKPREA